MVAAFRSLLRQVAKKKGQPSAAERQQFDQQFLDLMMQMNPEGMKRFREEQENGNNE
jgi:hypothetical protein